MEDTELCEAYLIPRTENGEELPSDICARLLKECEEFQHLVEGEARTAFLLSVREVVKGGKQVLGQAHMPTVQGQLKGVFHWALEKALGYEPDFLITLDMDFWEASGPKEREILVYHELCHCIQKTDREGESRWDEDGRPVWGIQSHDVEEFAATVRRYGPYSEDIRRFIAAAEAGAQ